MKNFNKASKLLPYKWELVILLWFAFFFNQGDRQIFNVVLPAIRDDLHLSDSDMGLISAILTLSYGILVPIAGFLGDRVNKKFQIIICLFVWTTATFFTGMSASLFSLLILWGFFLGGAEAFYSPPASALIGEYHEKTRSTAMSIHQTALYSGIIISGILTGWMADRFNWRVPFYVFGALGMILSLILLVRLKNSKPVRKETEVDSFSFSEGVRSFFKKPTIILLTLAFAGMVFVNVGFMTWMPTYLHEDFGFTFSRSGFDSTFYHYLGAFFGVLIGARIADRYSLKVIGMRGIVQSAGLLLGAPFIVLMGSTTSTTTLYVSLALFGLFRGIYDSNIFAALYDVVEPKYRSSSTGLMLMFSFITGAVAPYLLGVIKPVLGLGKGISALGAVYVLSSLCIFLAVKFFYKKDIISIN